LSQSKLASAENAGIMPLDIENNDDQPETHTQSQLVSQLWSQVGMTEV